MKIKVAIVALLVTLFTLGVVQEASAQAQCMPLDKAVEMLSTKHDEIPIASMKTKDGIPVRLWANLTTGTWTLFFVKGDEAQGTFGCLIDAGEGFRVGS